MTLYARIRSGKGTIRTGNLENGQERVLIGGVIYEVDEEEAALLQAAHPGLEVIEIKTAKPRRAEESEESEAPARRGK